MPERVSQFRSVSTRSRSGEREGLLVRDQAGHHDEVIHSLGDLRGSPTPPYGDVRRNRRASTGVMRSTIGAATTNESSVARGSARLAAAGRRRVE